MYNFFNEIFHVLIYKLGQQPTYHSHDNQYGRTQHIKHNEEHVNTEVYNVISGDGLTPSLPDC